MFSIFESSRYKSKPFQLLFIRYGPGSNDFYAFTDNEFPVTHLGITYEVRQFDTGEISTTGTLDKTALELRTPRNNPLFELFRGYPPSYRVTMTVMKSHYKDTDAGVVTIWAGRILGMTVRDSEASYSCEPISTTMRRLGLRRNWQYGCPHALYQGACKADKNRVKRNATVVSVTGSKVVLASGWNGSIGADKFIGGFAEVVSSGSVSTRTILRINGNELTVTGDTSKIVVGGQLAVFPGCSHSMADCKAVHDNILNFGGQPWIPTDNPVGAKNNFY